jgi:hypothetical protein
MRNSDQDRRRFPRYDTEVKIYFHLEYDIQTKVKFKVLASDHKGPDEHRYSGVSKNASAEGLCFISKKKLKIGDLLFIEVYEPKVKRPVKMEGEVRWSHKVTGPDKRKYLYITGVQLSLVNGKSVADSIYYDKKYKIVWSEVLDSLFGTFAAAIKKSG